MDQLNLYNGAYVGDGVTVGMNYSDIEKTLGTDLSIHRVGTTLELCADVVIDGRTWELHFDLTDEQEEKVQANISNQIDALNAEYGEWYVNNSNVGDISVDLDDLGFDPICDIAVLNLWNY